MSLRLTKSVHLLKEHSTCMLNGCVHKFYARTIPNVHFSNISKHRLCSTYGIHSQSLKVAFPFHLTCSSNGLCLSECKYSSRVSASWFQRRRKYKSYNIVGLGEVSSARPVLEHIKKPDYAFSGVTEENETDIEIKDEKQIECMRASCGLARIILDEVGNYIKVGVTTDELDRIVHSACLSFGAYPSPLNYRGFPKSVCTSVNNVACHGIPDDRPLKDGDIISIDVSVFYNGYHGDCAATYAVGSVDRGAQNLMNVSQQCLNEGIKVCCPGQPFCQIGKTISELAESQGFAVVPAFFGHGIGSYFHGPPNICHIQNDDNREMREGMTFTIEPVISEGAPDIVVLEDGWTAVTEDNSRCAQYEHTVLITKDGAEILTAQSKEQSSG